MKIIEHLRYLSFIVFAILTLHACTGKSSDSAESGAKSSSSKTKGEWLVNMNDAYGQSMKDNKPILAFFTSSDTCGLCKQLQTNVFSTPLFKDWAETNVVLLEIDFAKHEQLPEGNKEQNAGMARYLKVTGYPTVWILRVSHEAENGRFKVKPIGKTGNPKTPEEFIGMLQNLVRK